ncbi:MAG: pyridoxamine 5'-phosphate oxidase family protein [Acidimicrobiales bacterium]
MTADTPSEPMDERTGFAIIEPDECVALLASQPLGRIGFAADGAQVILPVNFLWHDGTVVFRTLEGQKLDAAIFAQPVAFEVDRWDPEDRSGWSVLIKGVAHRVSEWAEVEQLETQGLVPWSKREWRPYWVKIVPNEITGRRLV